MKGSESITDGSCPLIEPTSNERSGLGVTLGELTNERAKLAAPLCFGALRCGDHHVPPGFDSVRAAERVPLANDDGLGLVVDDRLHEIGLVGEVVVHLRAADFRRHLDVVQGGARHPASWIKAAASSTIRARVRAPLEVSLGRSLVSLTIHQC